MLLGTGLPDSAEHARWAVEVKWDGIRAQLMLDGASGWCLRSRPGSDRSERFPELACLAEQTTGPVVLDGELVHLAADGKPDFAVVRQRLTSRRRTDPRQRVTFVAFDALHAHGWNVRPATYQQRRALLRELASDGPCLRVPDYWTGEVDAVAAATREQQLEGIVCKRLDSPYRSGRPGTWLKHKHRRREALAVTAWSPGDGEPDTIYLARVGADGRWRPAGAAQYGLDADARARLREALRRRDRPSRRRARIRPVGDGITVVVDSHGRQDGWLRDPVMRNVVCD
ncbi:MAG: hypothetical protein AB7R67_23740 [Vicinamibacterales bacterium]